MTLGPDQALDRDTHDLLFVNGDRVLVADLRQAIKVRLLWFFREWFLDTDRGVPYFQQFFVKPFLAGHAKSALRSAIAGTPGVIAVQSLELTLDRTTRELAVSWTVLGEEGPVEGLDAVVIP